MPLTIATYFTYSEFNGGKKATFDEFRTELAKFARGAMTYTCSVINAVLKDWQGHWDNEAHDELVRNSFPPDIAAVIIAEARDPRRRRGLYHRQQLLFVAKEAIACCPDSGRDPTALPYGGGVGIVLLMANDLLPKGLSSTVPTPEQMINVLSEMIPIAEAGGFYNPINKIVRSHVMLTRFLPDENEGIRKVFHQATQISLDDYLALCFATLCRYYDMNMEKYKKSPGDFLLGQDWYKTIALSPQTVERFLSGISASNTEFNSILAKERGRNDFTCFKDKPIFRDGEIFFLVDAAFLAEKSEAGVFWQVNNALPTASRFQFHQDWGMAFERYINWLFATSVDGVKNRLHENPRFADNGEEVCDAIIECGDSVLFVESKGSTFTAEAKYGNDPEKLRQEIDEKLIHSEKQRKGVGQLALRIEEVFNRKAPRQIAGLDLSRVGKVFPVLVTRDDIGAALVINAYLASRFRALFNRKVVSAVVTPPFSLAAQDVEMICGYLKEATFAELLQERWKKDRGLLASFWTVDNDAISRIGGRECTAFADAFHDFCRVVGGVLFPGNLEMLNVPPSRATSAKKRES